MYRHLHKLCINVSTLPIRGNQDENECKYKKGEFQVHLFCHVSAGACFDGLWVDQTDGQSSGMRSIKTIYRRSN